MKNLRTLILLGILCLAIGVMAFTQFGSQRAAQADVPGSDKDQATYISQLYESTTELQHQANELDKEVQQYHKSALNGQSNLGAMEHELQDLRMANGEIRAIGPGVTVKAVGNLSIFELQDLVNELRNSSAEAIAVNNVRIVTRSAIVADENGGLVVDRQAIASPYHLDAIGEPDTLLYALQRKGGLIAVLGAHNRDLEITVTKHDTSNRADWLNLPKTAIDWGLVYGQPLP